jgi:hypothetical protein
LMLAIRQPQDEPKSVQTTAAEAASTQGASRADRTVFDLKDTHTFDVKPGGLLTMDADSGHIEIKTSDSSRATLEIIRRVSAETEDEAKGIAAHHVVASKAEGANLTVKAEMDETLKKSQERNKFKQIQFVVTLPKTYDLDVETAGGHISTEEITGTVKVRTAGGNMKLAAIKGPVVARTAGGNITLQDVVGDVQVHTSGGNITMGHVAGTVTAQTSGGNIEVEEVQGTISGTTSAGNITASISKQPAADCRLKTAGGNVRVTLSKDLKLSIDAATHAGRVQAPFAPSNSRKRQAKLKHELNGGGPSLNISTNAGNISLTFIEE